MLPRAVALPPSNGQVLEPEAVYTTHADWTEANEHVLVMACTDPRYQPARREFIEERFGLQLYDPLVVPGGPSSILTSVPYYFFVRWWVRMLNEVHGFRRAIAFAHYGCRTYHVRFPRLGEAARRLRQFEELRRFRAELARIVPGITAETYFAEPANGKIQFLKVD